MPIYLLYTGKCLPPLYFRTFHVDSQWANLRLGDFYAPEIEDRGHIVFVLSVIPSFCHSVILSETLTLLITFEQ